MNKRMLVLNVEVSGMNKFLFSHLKKRGWELSVIDVPFPRALKWIALASTFRPSMAEWKKKFSERLGKLYKSPWTFIQRTKFCEKKIRDANGSFDLIFQISGMFAPSVDLTRLNIPCVTYNDYTVMCSYTMALCGIYDDWAPFPFQLKRYLELESNLYQNARQVFATNENVRKSLMKDYGVDENKIKKVGYGATIEEIPEIAKQYDGKTVLFIGMDFKRKGGYVLLDAFKKVREAIPDARVLIVGPDKDIVKINQEGVKMVGCIRDRDKIKDFYKQASVFVMPSLCEPFGLVFLEAMAHKLPCIGTTVDAMPESIRNGKNGYVVPPKDPEALAEKIITLLSNQELMKKMGEEAHRCVKEDFKWDTVVGDMDLYLNAILNNQKPSQTTKILDEETISIRR